jgi:hypothetical protein
MPTKLEKEIVRESTVLIDNRNVNITLTADQKINLKLKGMKSGDVEISIEDLYNYLKPTKIEKKEEVRTSLTIENTPENKASKSLISLTDFRSQYLISTDFDLLTKTKLEAITVKLLNGTKEYKYPRNIK